MDGYDALRNNNINISVCGHPRRIDGMYNTTSLFKLEIMFSESITIIFYIGGIPTPCGLRAQKENALQARFARYSHIIFATEMTKD